jgi:hypothetical protein
MRFIAIYRQEKENPMTPEHIEAMGKYIEEAVNAGVLLAADGIGPSTAADARVRLRDGKFVVTDGPFAEAKEQIGGFAIMQADSREEVLEWTRRFLLIAGDGESEVRQLYEMSPVDVVRSKR